MSFDLGLTTVSSCLRIWLEPNEDAERFRQEAEERRHQAVKAIDQRDKEGWLRLAADWIKLAEEADRRREVFFERPAHPGSKAVVRSGLARVPSASTGLPQRLT